MLSFLLSKYPEVELLDGMLAVCFTLKKLLIYFTEFLPIFYSTIFESPVFSPTLSMIKLLKY